MASRKSDSPWQTLTIQPLAGGLDTRSETESVPAGTWRYKSNFQMSGGTKLACRPGHDKLFSGLTNPNLTPPSFTNFDFHDQGSLSGAIQTNYVNFLFQAQLNSGQHFLYAGTQERLGWLDETTGYWNIISTGKGGTPQSGLPSTRFKAGELNEQILFTNNVDAPFLTTVNTTSIAAIPSLNNIDGNGLNLEKAAVVVEFRGFLLLMDLTMSGKRFSSRIAWCDYQLPNSWQWYQNNSLSGFQDLDPGEEILAATVMANSLYILTTRGIWTGFVSAVNSNTSGAGVGNPVFSFQSVYAEKKNGAKCMVYPNMLANEGNGIWYGGSDGIYYYDPYLSEPTREEWAYRATTAIYNDFGSAIQSGCCSQPIMEIFPDDKEIYISWPEPSANPNGQCVNSKTIVLNYQYKSPDIVDFGYTAFCNYVPAQPAGTGVVCPQDALFVAASSSDLCLKQIGTIYSRTRCTNSTSGRGSVISGNYIPFTGSYITDGYYRILRMLIPTQNLDRDKSLRSLLLDVSGTDQLTPCIIQCRLGTSYSDSDPNLPPGKCSVLWRQLSPRTLKCPNEMTSTDYVRSNIVPNEGVEWNYTVKGRFIYLEFRVANQDGSPAIGGASVYSRIETEIRLETKP